MLSAKEEPSAADDIQEGNILRCCRSSNYRVNVCTTSLLKSWQLVQEWQQNDA